MSTHTAIRRCSSLWPLLSPHRARQKAPMRGWRAEGPRVRVARPPVPAVPGCLRLSPAVPRLSPARPAGGRRGAPLHGQRGGTGTGAERERERGEGRRPTAALLSLQVEFLPERDLDSDGTKISVSVAAGRGQSPPAGGPFLGEGPPRLRAPSLLLPRISSSSAPQIAGSWAAQQLDSMIL